MSTEVSNKNSPITLEQIIRESHIYPSLPESVLRTVLLIFMTAASIYCLKSDDAPTSIGVALLLYVLSIISEIVPKLTHLTNGLNRFYIFLFVAWIFVMAAICGRFLTEKQTPALEWLKNITSIPYVICAIDTFTYILWGKQNNDSGYTPETNLKEMRNIK